MTARPVPNRAAALVHMADEVATLGREYLDERRRLAAEGKPIGVPFGIESVDRALVPPKAGDLVTFLGRPGNGKSAMLIRWLRWWAKVVQNNEDVFANQYVAYISTEQCVEDLNAFMAAAGTGVNIEDMARGRVNDVEWRRIEKWSADRASLPLVIIGHSQARRKARVPLTMEMIGEAITYIEDKFKLKPSLIGLDYLQQVRSPAAASTDNKTIAIANNLAICKDIAVWGGCPMAIAVQAKREVDQRDPPVPGMDDGQWTSNVEQDSDIMFSAVRPIKYRRLGGKFWDWTVEDENMLLLMLLKQRLGKAPSRYMLRFDPRYNQLDRWEDQRILEDPNRDQE